MSDQEYEDFGDLGTVTLTLDDDSELECLVIAIYPAGGKDYIALLPMKDGTPDEDADVLIYRYIDRGDGSDPALENIESDDEFDVAADAFDELQDDVEFEALDDGE